MNATSHDRTDWAPLPVLLAGAFMVVLDFFIVNVALPSIATELGAGDTSLEWVVAGYGLTFAAFLITAGRLGDGLGRRHVYMIGLALFTATSAACGLAPSPTTLVIARIAQGVAGAIVMPQVLAIIGVTYRGPSYVRAMSLYGMALGLAAVGGQVIGGALVDADVAGLGWRSCFLINVPIGLVALALAPRLVPESRAERRARLDVAGAAILAIGLTAVLLPLIQGRELGWPAWTWASFARRRPRPDRLRAAPAPAVRNRRRPPARAGSVSRAWLLRRDRGSALPGDRPGLVLRVPGALPAAGPRPDRAPGGARLHDPRGRLRGGLRPGARPDRALRGLVVGAGGVALTAGLGLLAVGVAEIGTSGTLLALVPGLILAGAGIGLCFTPLTATVLATVEPALAGGAAGAMSAITQVGYALGVADHRRDLLRAPPTAGSTTPSS